MLASNSAALGTAAGGTTVNSGATLALQGGISIADALTIIGNGVGGGGALRNLTGNNNYTGAITLGAGGARINSDAGLLTTSGASITSAQPLIVGGAGDVTISNVIATGAGTLTKDGAGTLTLSGANTYAGATAINAGTLIADNGTALGTIAGGTTVATGATLNVNNVTLAESALSINGTGVGGAGALTGTGAAVVSGTVATTGASNIGTTSAASTLKLNGLVTATAGNLGIVGAGSMIATNNINNDFGTVNINGATNVSLRDVNGIILGGGASSLTGNLSLQTAGTITQTAGITVGGATTLTAGATNDITLSNIANNFNTVAITSGRDVNLVDANTLTVNVSSVRMMTAQTLSNDLTLGGAITAFATTGTAIHLVSAANFLNPGNNALTTGLGSRWLVYSTSPLLDTRGAALLAASDFKQYNTTFGGAILGAGDGFIYSLAPTITPTLTGSATKTYNGTLAAPIGGLALGQSGAIDGDTIILGGLTSATYDTVNAGTGKTVSASGISITSQANGAKPVFGYQLASTTATGAVGTINQATLNLNAVTDTKTYNGNTNSAGVVTTAGLVGGDSVTGLAQSFASKNVLGANGSTLNVNAGFTVNDGNSGNNYTVTSNSATGTITAAALNLNAVTDTKTYNGNTNSAGVVTTAGLVGGDSVTGLAQSFASKNVLGANGSTLNVNAGFTVNDGNSGNNYTVASNSATGTITARAISSVTGITAADKVYDGNTSAVLTTTGAVFNNIVAGENLSITGASGVFNSKDVLTATTVNISGIGLADNGTTLASNYSLSTTTASDAANITPASLIVTANDAIKIQGSVNPPFSSLITGFVNGETSAVLFGALGHNTPAITSSPAGNYAITPFGLSASNYDITFVDGLLKVSAPTNIAAIGLNLNLALTRPEQALQICGAESVSSAMISGLDAFGVDNVEYKESINQPLVGGVVANELVSPACLKI